MGSAWSYSPSMPYIPYTSSTPVVVSSTVESPNILTLPPLSTLSTDDASVDDSTDDASPKESSVENKDAPPSTGTTPVIKPLGAVWHLYCANKEAYGNLLNQTQFFPAYCILGSTPINDGQLVATSMCRMKEVNERTFPNPVLVVHFPHYCYVQECEVDKEGIPIQPQNEPKTPTTPTTPTTSLIEDLDKELANQSTL